MKKKIALFTLVIFVTITLIFLIKYIYYTSNYISSNAGFVKTNSLTYLSFKEDGKINYLPFKAGDRIKKGNLVASLETRELNTTLNQINFDILSLQNKIDSLLFEKNKLINEINFNINLIKNQIDILNKNIEAKKTDIKSLEVKLKKAEDDKKRYLFLFKRKKISIDKYETINTKYNLIKLQIKSAKQTLKAIILSKNSLLIKQKLIKNQKNDIKKLEKNIEALKDSKKSMEYKAKLIKEKIANSFIYMPFDGIIAKKYVNNHQVIKKGQNIITIVNPKDIYISVFLEETKLKNLKIGNSATIHIDALDKNYNAKVTTILPASEATFSIVPRDLSSGEFTKLTQRFIVKLKILNPDNKLKIGMSCEVEIKK